MDDASRGPLGAFSVLVFWTGGSLAALGSIITLLMIAFGPFLQQLVEYPSRNMTQHDSFALAPRNLAYTLHFPPTSDEFAISPWEENVELVHLLEAGIWSDPKPFDQEPTCSTGHCSWPEYKSVGWCGKCEDRTHSSTLRNCKAVDIRENKNYTTEYCVLDLGNGHKAPLFKDLEVTLDEDDTLNINGNYTAEAIWPFNSGNSGATMSILGVTELSSGPEKILGVDNPLIAIAHATVKLANDSYEDLEFNVLQIVETSQCILHPCEKTLSLTRVNGTTTWSGGLPNYGNIIARNVSLTNPRGQHPVKGLITLCWQAEHGDLDLATFDEENYAVDNDKRAFCPVEDYAYDIQNSLKGRYTQEFGLGWSPTNSGYISDEGIHSTMSSNTIGPQSARNLSQRMESIAVGLTNWGQQTTNDTELGKAYAEESYVRVRWQWIALPAFLELASLALLVLMIIPSRRNNVPLWKSSVLALVYHGVDELRGQESVASEHSSGMEVTAKTTDVQLVKSEDGLNSLSKRSGYRPLDQDG
jgi:hypothetical protein